MAEILICPTGTIKPKTAKALREAGVIVVECDTPERVQLIRASSVLSADDLFWASMKALQLDTFSGGKEQREQFTKILFSLIDAERTKRQRARDVKEDKPHD